LGAGGLPKKGMVPTRWIKDQLEKEEITKRGEIHQTLQAENDPETSAVSVLFAARNSWPAAFLPCC